MFTLWNASTAWLRNLQRLYQRELDQQEVARLELQARPETLPFLARQALGGALDQLLERPLLTT
jgi:hypothetical protein